MIDGHVVKRLVVLGCNRQRVRMGGTIVMPIVIPGG